MTGRPVSEPKATTRMSAPSSVRMLESTRLGDALQRVGVDVASSSCWTRLRRTVEPRAGVGRPDVGDQAGLEALAQPVLQRAHVARQAVGGEHELRAGAVERVEGVEELLLGARLALEELDVVDEQHVDVAVARP